MGPLFFGEKMGPLFEMRNVNVEEEGTIFFCTKVKVKDRINYRKIKFKKREDKLGLTWFR